MSDNCNRDTIKLVARYCLVGIFFGAGIVLIGSYLLSGVKEEYEKKARERVCEEAVNHGYGKWEVDEDTLEVDFVWRDERRREGGEEGKVESDEGEGIGKGFRDDRSDSEGKYEGYEVSTGGNGVGRDRKFRFTYTDYEYFKGLGMDLEGSIIMDTRNVIGRVFSNIGEDIDLVELESVLKDGVQEAIHKRFDGFETYKGVQ